MFPITALMSQFITSPDVQARAMALTEIAHIDEDDRMADCIDNCLEAAQACEWCADECIRLGEEEMTRCIQLCRDVADVATLHARFMARNSSFEGDLAAVCAELCRECADECATHDHDHCQTCADVVSRCANSCEEMATS